MEIVNGYSLNQVLTLMAIGLFIGALIGAGVVNYVRSTKADRTATRINENIFEIFAKLDGIPSLVQVAKGNQKLYLELVKLINTQIDMAKPEEEVKITRDDQLDEEVTIVFKTILALAIGTLKNTLKIDLGNDKSDLQAIKLITKEAIKNITMMSNEIDVLTEDKPSA